MPSDEADDKTINSSGTDDEGDEGENNGECKFVWKFIADYFTVKYTPFLEIF